MDDEERKYIEHFKSVNEGAVETKQATSPETKVLRIIALLIFGGVVIYLFTARIW